MLTRYRTASGSERMPAFNFETQRIPISSSVERLIRSLPLVIINLISPQELAELVLKRNLPMVWLLFTYVSAHLLDMRLANGKRSIAALPVELFVWRSLRLDPFR